MHIPFFGENYNFLGTWHHFYPMIPLKLSEMPLRMLPDVFDIEKNVATPE